MSQHVITVGGEQFEYHLEQMCSGEWIAYTESRHGVSCTPGWAVENLIETLEADIFTPDNPAIVGDTRSTKDPKPGGENGGFAAV